MNSLWQIRRRCLAATLAGVMLIRSADAGSRPVPLDPAFKNGLAALKASTGFIENKPGLRQTQWKPDLQVLVGVKAVEGQKQTVRIVELTTLHPPPTNSTGQPWAAPMRTNKWNWSGTNGPAATNQSAEYVSSIYPVHVRVFDETGSSLTEGVTALPWGSLTNTLVDLCRISLALNRKTANPGGNHANGTMQTNDVIALAAPLRLRKHRQPLESKVGTAKLKPANTSPEPVAPPPNEFAERESYDTPPQFRESDDLMRSVGGGFLWMMTMFEQLRTVPAARGIWEKVRYAVRLPNVWTVATSVLKGRLELSLRPQFADISLANPAAGKEAHFHLPVQMSFGKQNLGRLDIIVGPASGAEMLLAGIKSIRAVHPDRPDQELMAQVLATGSVSPTQ